jgi:predicted DsbA family dithiol-disulfide isomerase
MRRLEVLYGDQLEIQFVLGGLVRDFEDFHDEANGISEPADVAPHWTEASRRHGMPVDVGVWEENPPRSTWPASVAAKAAALQDPGLGFRYLRRLREATLTERRNIADRETLFELAASVGLDLAPFAGALEDGRAERAFREDLRRMKERGVRGFPTFEVEVDGAASILGTYQPFERLERALRRHAPGLERRDLPRLEAFVDAYGYVATREVAEVYEFSRNEAQESLKKLAKAGDVEAVSRGNGTFWRPVHQGELLQRGTGEFSLQGELPWREADSPAQEKAFLQLQS